MKALWRPAECWPTGLRTHLHERFNNGDLGSHVNKAREHGSPIDHRYENTHAGMQTVGGVVLWQGVKASRAALQRHQRLSNIPRTAHHKRRSQPRLGGLQSTHLLVLRGLRVTGQHLQRNARLSACPERRLS